MSKTAARTVDLEPIDRLEEKVKLLVDLVDRMKQERAQAAEENTRLQRDLETLRQKQQASETTMGSELTTLREERDVIRTRVSEMLEQLDALNL